MRVLLVTGQLAEEMVKEYSKQSSVETQTIALQSAVAAFLTPQIIAKALQSADMSGFNMILVPGLVRGDVAEVSKVTGVPAFKGPRYAADLPLVLDSLCEVQLSTTVPACELMQEKLRQKALQEIQKTEKDRVALLKKPGNLKIGGLAVGKDFPMRILAEIVDAALLDKETIQQTAKRFVAAGADLIDVGMIAGESQPKKAQRMVKWVKQVTKVPSSIDTLDPAEIKAAIGAGVDLVLSVDAGNIEEIAPFCQNVAVVVIPTNQRQGYFPKKAQDRVQFIEEIITKAKSLGMKRVLADLILEPTDILESFIAFREFAERNPGVPLFVGVSNVTELFDADSVGINALLAKLSQEINASMLLATEKSPKAKGTVAEEVTAAKMMFLAKKRGSVPKDLGVDLLILKDKRTHEEPFGKELETTAKVIHVPHKLEPTILDSAGMFKIYLDRNEHVLIAVHYVSPDVTVPNKIFKGKTAESVYAKIVQTKLVSKLDHTAYLGSELAKAEIALRTGKGYVQDGVLFQKINHS